MKLKEKTLLLELFWTFLKISPITFGGGFAMMPLIKKEVVDKRKWIEEEEMIDAFALSQSTPGSVGINSSAFIGFRVAGFKGALVATLGIMAPTFVIVLLLSLLFLSVKNNTIIEAAFKGIRTAVVALIAYAAILTIKSSVIDKSTFVILAVAVLLLIAFHLHPILLILSGLGSGILVGQIKKLEKMPSSANGLASKDKVES